MFIQIYTCIHAYIFLQFCIKIYWKAVLINNFIPIQSHMVHSSCSLSIFNSLTVIWLPSSVSLTNCSIFLFIISLCCPCPYVHVLLIPNWIVTPHIRLSLLLSLPSVCPSHPIFSQTPVLGHLFCRWFPPSGSENPSEAVLLPLYGCLLILFGLWSLILCCSTSRDALIWASALCRVTLPDLHLPHSIQAPVSHSGSPPWFWPHVLELKCLRREESRKGSKNFYKHLVKHCKYTARIFIGIVLYL